MTDLKQRVIENIQIEGAFDMDYWGDFDSLVKGEVGKENCGTACCLAGHIINAASQLGISYNNLSVDMTYRSSLTGTLARRIWASQYRQEEADRLEFNHAWGNLYLVKPEDVIAHLNGADPTYYR